VTDTLVTLWQSVRDRLTAAGVDTPVLDARLLVEAGAGVSRMDIVTDPRRAISAEQFAGVDALVRRREAREPVSHIIGRKHFWTLEFEVNKHVLTPRPETEFVVEAGLRAIAAKPDARILDLGVGSGAILLTLLVERPRTTGFGTDISEEALVVARANAKTLRVEDRVELRSGDWAAGVNGGFDLVVSNPPYIATDEIKSLAPEVSQHEPRIALDGGADGLAAYRIIIADLPRLLKPGGNFALEVGRGQADAVAAIAKAAGLSTGEPWRDLAGLPRVVVGERAA
jgi:release factor glutamine methyltransferase